jgi:hypothetical protein
MSFSIYKPTTKYIVGSGGGGTTNNVYLDVSVDISATIYTDICQYDSTYWQNVNKTIGKVSIADSANLDSFGRLRMSSPKTMFDGKMIDSSQNIIFDSSWNNGGRLIYLPNESSMSMDVSLANSFVKRQTHYFAQYQPGKSLLGLASFYFGLTIPVGAYKRVGMFDDSEGIFFEQTSTGLRWRIESLSAPDVSVSQNNWNIDKLDGTGPSGFTLNMNNTNILLLDIEWLGVGRVRVGFVINGLIVYCHQFTQSLQSVYIKSPYLPIRYEIGTTTLQTFDVSMKQICCSVISEGGYEPLGLLASYLNETSINLNDTTYTPVISARLRNPYQKGEFKPLFFDLAGGGGTTLFFKVLRNATLTGPTTWKNVNDYSEVDVSSTGVTGGLTMITGFVINSNRLQITDVPDNLLVFQSNINGVADIFTVVVKSSNGNKTVNTSLTWQETV